MNLFQALENVRLGLFIQRLEKLKTIETRKQRKLRVGKERTKQLEDSFNSVGLGYHKQHGWIAWTQ